MQAQREEVIHTESPRNQRQSWDGGPSFEALHPSGHAEGARQQLPYTASQQTLMEVLGQAPCLKCSRPRPCLQGDPGEWGERQVVEKRDRVSTQLRHGHGTVTRQGPLGGEGGEMGFSQLNMGGDKCSSRRTVLAVVKWHHPFRAPQAM